MTCSASALSHHAFDRQSKKHHDKVVDMSRERHNAGPSARRERAQICQRSCRGGATSETVKEIQR